MAATASTSRLARSPSPSGLDTTDDVLPLAFDSEAELLGILARLRDGLKERTATAWAQGGKQGNLEDVERIVLKDFFDKVTPRVSSNCTIAGLSYAKHRQRDDPSQITQPFNDELHERVVLYQDKLFEAREQNVETRKDFPKDMVEIVRKRLGEDSERVAQLEARRTVAFEERVKAPLPNRRKSSAAKGTNADGLSAQEREEYFAEAKGEIDRMLDVIPKLNTEAASATQVAKDASAVFGP
ncbi:hypothetical protein RQP46_009518 [Phenoliferia psychrophenolica]